MTTDMHLIERAYELGRAAERQKMADLASIASNESLAKLASAVSENVISESNGPTRKNATKTFKAVTKAIGTTAAPKVARGVKKAAGPRTKGVKEAIVGIIDSAPVTVNDIIAQTGFKETSVRATLMGLKKTGRAMQDGKAWIGIVQENHSGNSETASRVNV